MPGTRLAGARARGKNVCKQTRCGGRTRVVSVEKVERFADLLDLLVREALLLAAASARPSECHPAGVRARGGECRWTGSADKRSHAVVVTRLACPAQSTAGSQRWPTVDPLWSFVRWPRPPGRTPQPGVVCIPVWLSAFRQGGSLCGRAPLAERGVLDRRWEIRCTWLSRPVDPSRARGSWRSHH